MKHVVRFEPVGIEIEVDEEQTILRAAAEQGVMLMHGCKEGQCASCKSFVLDGEDIDLDRYSTFALPEYELDEGYTLLCRAHAFEDLTIELLNYDEDMIRSGLPIQERTAEVVAITPVTHDLRHLVLKLSEPGETFMRVSEGRSPLLGWPIHCNEDDLGTLVAVIHDAHRGHATALALCALGVVTARTSRGSTP